MNIPFLDNLSLRMKAFYMLSLPILGMIWLATLLVTVTWEKHENAVMLDKLVVIADSAVKILPLLQIERGMSAIFIGSEGERFHAKLPAQRNRVDSAIEDFMQVVSNPDIDLLPSKHQKVLKGLISQLARIKDLRIRVDKLSLDPLAAIKSYSLLTGQIIHVTRMIPQFSQFASVSADATAYSSVVEVMEFAGIERATVASGLVNGVLSATQWIRQSTMASKQQAALDVLPELLDTQSNTFANQQLSVPAVSTVTDIRANIAYVQLRTHHAKELLAGLGFGGLRDDFNNLQRTGSPEHESAFNQKYRAVSDALQRFQALTGLTAQDEEDLSAVSQLLMAYSSRVSDAYIGAQLLATERAANQALHRLVDPKMGLDVAGVFGVWSSYISQLIKIQERIGETMISKTKAIKADAEVELWNEGAIKFALLVLTGMLSFYLGRSVMKQLGGDPAELQRMISHIAEGDLDVLINVDPEHASGCVANVHQMRATLKANNVVIGRSQKALDSISANVMLADENYNIIYINDSLIEMFRNAETDIQSVLPQFSVGKLIGSNMDMFHGDPERIRRVVETLTEPYKSNVEIGPRTMTWVVTPIYDESKKRQGTVIEWKDRTEQVSVEKEIEGVVNACSHGALNHRLDMDGKKGFYRTLAAGMNQMLEVNEGVVCETRRVLGALAKGDLTQTIEKDYEGAYAELKNHANTTVSTFMTIIGRIQDASRTVRVAASEISKGNVNLSQRTESQASSLEETAASMEEMTGIVKKNAAGAQESSALSAAARGLAEQGGEIVGKAVIAMGEINESSKQIAEIISVIDEIAFQTNLLALNAAVEAARAGEQGRGFAVVAGEVGKLAQRSASAAKEIKDLIDDSSNKVNEGARSVNASGEMLKEIVTSVAQVNELISEISGASQEQSSGIGQVNAAVLQMDEATQQNAALVEEVAAASETMEEQVLTLNELVSFFRVTAGSGEVSQISTLQSMSAAQPTKASGSLAATGAATGTYGGARDDDDWEEF